jgi:hypothetical protein
MKVAIVGSRDFDWTPTENNDHTRAKSKLIEFLVVAMESDDYVITGGANGADSHAERFAMRYNVGRIIHCANWQKHGNFAGFARNKLIVADADILFAFFTDRADSKGTKHSVDGANKKGIPVYEYDAKTDRWWVNGKQAPECFVLDYDAALGRVIEATAQRDEGEPFDRPWLGLTGILARDNLD